MTLYIAGGTFDASVAELVRLYETEIDAASIGRAFTRQQGMDLSVGSTKTLLHNAAMVDLLQCPENLRTCD